MINYDFEESVFWRIDKENRLIKDFKEFLNNHTNLENSTTIHFTQIYDNEVLALFENDAGAIGGDFLIFCGENNSEINLIKGLYPIKEYTIYDYSKLIEWCIASGLNVKFGDNAEQMRIADEIKSKIEWV